MQMIQPKRSKFKKSTINYVQDNILDIIDIEETLSKNRFIEKIHIIFCGLAAYLYYNGMDHKILNDVATSYFCYYHDMTEIFNMNNIYLYNHELNEKFYMNFLRVFDIYKDSKDPNQKVIR